MPTPATDFLRKVQTWQEDDANRTAGLVVVMPDREEQSLDGLLAELRVSGRSAALEDRARTWLVGYREMEARQRVLTEEQRAELDSICAVIPLWQARREREQHSRSRSKLRSRVIVAVIVGVIALIAGIGTRALISSDQPGPPPAGVVQPANPGPQPGPLTGQQQFRADWDVPQAATADAGNPAALVWLDAQDQLYHPVLWTVPAGDAGWQDDTAGSISASVQGGDVTVTDSDGNSWTVSPGQPFVISSDPQVVYRVLRDGTIQSMPQPHAIRVRTRL
jgi:uncharacterized cupin superfamily protein